MDRPFRFPCARRALAAAAALTVFASPAVAEDAAPPFLRFDDTRLGVAIVRGLEQSATFRAIFDRLSESDLIVYVRPGFLSGPTAAATQLMTSAGGYRYVRVTLEIDPRTDTGLALLGHELWHVLELAEAPWVTTKAALNEHYERIGYRSCDAALAPCYDTEAAVAAGYQVLKELRGVQAPGALHALRLPVALREEPGADGRQRDEGDADGDEGAGGTEAAGRGEEPRQRNLPQPQDDKVDPRRRPSIAGAVERLGQHHAVAGERKPERHDAKAADAESRHVGVAGENGY
jgi:hypothetical protein